MSSEYTLVCYISYKNNNKYSFFHQKLLLKFKKKLWLQDAVARKDDGVNPFDNTHYVSICKYDNNKHSMWP